MPDRIYLSPPEVFPGDRESLLEAFDSGWIAPVGPAIEAFEKDFSTHMGGGYAVALSSGTAALHLALLETGVKPGDEVLCSTLSFVASANAVKYCGARPVFIDAERESWNMDPALLADALEERARAGNLPAAVEVVHVYGQCANMTEICALCEQYNVPLIEDAAEAVGARFKGRAAGGFGRMSAFSFNGNKLITTAGGGMLWSADEKLVRRVRHLASQARLPDRGYLHKETGYNYRMSNLLAALGRAQLANLPERVRRRRAVFECYWTALSDLPGVSFMPKPESCESTRWLTCILLDPATSPVSPEALMDALEAEAVESRPVWRPLHCQPVFKDCQVYGGSVAEDLSARGICLPSSGALTVEEQDRVIASLRGCFKRS